MEKSKVSRSTKTKRATPAAKARYEMIKNAAMKFANQNKAKVVTAKKSSVAAAKKKKPKGKIGIPLRKDREARREQREALLIQPTIV